MQESPTLKRASVSIIKSTYDLLCIINPNNIIQPAEWVIHKVTPLKKLIISLKEEFKDSNEIALTIQNLNFFDLIVGKGIDSLNDKFGDKGLPLVFISEWIRIWLNIIRRKSHYSYSHKIWSYIWRLAKTKLVGYINTINYETVNKENLPVYVSLILYASTIPDNSEDDLIIEYARIKTINCRICLSNLNESLAVGLIKPPKTNLSIDSISLSNVYWILYLTPLFKFSESQKESHLMTIENPLNMIKALASGLSINDFDDYHVQLEHHYLSWIYLFYIFNYVDSMLKNKQISKIKINSTLDKEIDSIIQTAWIVCK